MALVPLSRSDYRRDYIATTSTNFELLQLPILSSYLLLPLASGSSLLASGAYQSHLALEILGRPNFHRLRLLVPAD